MGRALTYTPNKVQQAGRIPKTIDKETVRPYRSFFEERERQLLKQVATQLYFSANQMLKQLSKEGLTEIQMMHMDFKGRHTVFVAANAFEITSALAKSIVASDFKTMLTTVRIPVESIAHSALFDH